MNTVYETSATPHLTITCHGDLSINGTSDRVVAITADGDPGDTQLERNGETIVVKTRKDCAIECPEGSSITLQLASGDLHISQITGALAIENVNGDAKLREIGGVMIKNLQGDLSLRDSAGQVDIDSVRGDAALKQIDGALNINRVSGDLVAAEIEGGVTIGTVSGDVKLEVELLPDQSYNVNANGDLVLNVLGGGAKFNLSSKGEIRNRLSMSNWQGNDRSATGVFGDGSATVNLVSRGDILILAGNSGWSTDGISDHVESMIESAMGRFETEMSRVQKQLEERFGNQADRLRRQTDRAKKRAERAAGSWGSFFASSRGSAPSTPPSEPVSDQERMAILKMVEEKKITADEAAKLLAALDS
jgi:DUF4097 and DUF4098 domain-containing protein YvlB